MPYAMRTPYQVYVRALGYRKRTGSWQYTGLWGVMWISIVCENGLYKCIKVIRGKQTELSPRKVYLNVIWFVQVFTIRPLNIQRAASKGKRLTKLPAKIIWDSATGDQLN